MSRWFQAIQISGYLSRYEQECAEYERQRRTNIVKEWTSPNGWRWTRFANGELRASSPNAKSVI